MDIEITEKPIPITNKNYYRTQKYKTENILRTQKGSKYYNTDTGIDIEYFFMNDLDFPVSSFKSYIIQELIIQGVNLNNVILQKVDSFTNELRINIKEII